MQGTEQIIIANIIEERRKLKPGRAGAGAIKLGASIHQYEIYYEVGKTSYPGKIIFHFKKGERGTKERSVLFQHVASAERAQETFYRLRRLQNPSIVCPWFAVFQKDLGGWFVCYDRFHKYWIDHGNLLNVGTNKQYLEESLKRLICDLLSALKCLHAANLVHGTMGEYTSYVMENKRVKLINIYGAEDNQHKKLGDLRDFGNILHNRVLVGNSTPSVRNDWHFFSVAFQLLQSPDRVDLLLKHPLFRTPDKRSKLFHKIHLSVKSLRKSEQPPPDGINGMAKYYNWDILFNDQSTASDIMKESFETFKRKCDKRFTATPYILLKFVRGFGEHYHLSKTYRKMEVRDKHMFIVDESISLYLPGFLSELYEVVKIRGKF